MSDEEDLLETLLDRDLVEILKSKKSRNQAINELNAFEKEFFQSEEMILVNKKIQIKEKFCTKMNELYRKKRIEGNVYQNLKETLVVDDLEEIIKMKTNPRNLELKEFEDQIFQELNKKFEDFKKDLDYDIDLSLDYGKEVLSERNEKCEKKKKKKEGLKKSEEAAANKFKCLTWDVFLKMNKCLSDPSSERVVIENDKKDSEKNIHKQRWEISDNFEKEKIPEKLNVKSAELLYVYFQYPDSLKNNYDVFEVYHCGSFSTLFHNGGITNFHCVDYVRFAFDLQKRLIKLGENCEVSYSKENILKVKIDEKEFDVPITLFAVYLPFGKEMSKIHKYKDLMDFQNGVIKSWGISMERFKENYPKYVYKFEAYFPKRVSALGNYYVGAISLQYSEYGLDSAFVRFNRDLYEHLYENIRIPTKRNLLEEKVTFYNNCYHGKFPIEEFLFGIAFFPKLCYKFFEFFIEKNFPFSNNVREVLQVLISDPKRFQNFCKIIVCIGGKSIKESIIFSQFLRSGFESGKNYYYTKPFAEKILMSLFQERKKDSLRGSSVRKGVIKFLDTKQLLSTIKGVEVLLKQRTEKRKIKKKVKKKFTINSKVKRGEKKKKVKFEKKKKKLKFEKKKKIESLEDCLCYYGEIIDEMNMLLKNFCELNYRHLVYLPTNLPMPKGCSGSGLFDENGNIIGICCFADSQNLTCYFVTFSSQDMIDYYSQFSRFCEFDKFLRNPDLGQTFTERLNNYNVYVSKDIIDSNFMKQDVMQQITSNYFTINKDMKDILGKLTISLVEIQKFLNQSLLHENEELKSRALKKLEELEESLKKSIKKVENKRKKNKRR